MPSNSVFTPRDLMEAVEAGDIGKVKQLLTAGVDVNAEVGGGFGFMTPLIKAVMRNPDPEMITLLLDNGADLEAKRAYGGYTALMQAVLNDRPQIAELLLERGADQRTQNFEGLTALDIAVARNNDPLERILRAAPQQREKRPVVPLGLIAKERATITGVQAQLRAAAAKRPKVLLKRGGFPSP